MSNQLNNRIVNVIQSIFNNVILNKSYSNKAGSRFVACQAKPGQERSGLTDKQTE